MDESQCPVVPLGQGNHFRRKPVGSGAQRQSHITASDAEPNFYAPTIWTDCFLYRDTVDTRETSSLRAVSSWREKSSEAVGSVHGLLSRDLPDSKKISGDWPSPQQCASPEEKSKGARGRVRRQKERIKDYMSSILRPNRSQPQPRLEQQSMWASNTDALNQGILLAPRFRRSTAERTGSLGSTVMSTQTDQFPPSLSRTVDTCETAFSFAHNGDEKFSQRPTRWARNLLNKFSSSQNLPQQQSDAIDTQLSLMTGIVDTSERLSQISLPLTGKDVRKAGKANESHIGVETTTTQQTALAEAEIFESRPCHHLEVSRAFAVSDWVFGASSTAGVVSYSEAQSSLTKAHEEHHRLSGTDACDFCSAFEPVSPPMIRHSHSRDNIELPTLPEQSDTTSNLEYNVSSDSSFESGSSSDESGPLCVEKQKQILLERLMEYFYFAVSPSLPFPPIDRIPADYSRSNWALPSRRTSDGTTSSNPSSVGRVDSKRLPDELDDEPSGGGDGQKRARLETSEYGETARLACPYFKRTPQRYCTSKWRSCPGPGWNTVHRVKEHIYRCHALPITCPRCHGQFENTSLRDSHLVADERCKIRDKPELDGFDSTQEKLLRKRNKGAKHLTEADKWRDVYLILFPDTGPGDIPSPYLDFGGNASTGEAESAFDRYERYLRRELPKRVRQELEIRIDQALEPLEENLKSQIVDIVRDAQLALFQSFVSEPTNSTMRIDQGNDEDPTTTVTGKASSSTDNRLVFDGQLEALRPPPYLEEDLADFNGLLFDLSDGQAFQDQPAADDFFGMIDFGGNSTSVRENTAVDLRAFPLSDNDSAYVSMSLSSGSRFELDRVDKQ